MSIKKNELKNALSRGMRKKIYIERIKNVEKLEATSRNFNITRFTVIFKRHSSKKNERLDLILKRLKPNPPKTDFSGKSTIIHREIARLPDYTRRLFEYLQGPINNGSDGDHLVRFYGQEGNDLYEEDAGDVSVEKLFIEKTPNSGLLKRLVQAIAIEHNKWTKIMISHTNELYDIRRENRFREKLHDNLDTILGFHDKSLKVSDENLLGKFFLGIDNYFKDHNFNMFIRLIHSDLHLGHIFLKYNNKKFADILKIDKDDLNKYNPKIKIVDVSGMSIGPQTFDLVDVLKHPVAINADDRPTQREQRRFIEYLVEIYRTKRLEEFLDSSDIKIKNNGSGIKKSLDFITLFYITDIYRSIRAIAKGILVKTRHPELHKKYLTENLRYDLYQNWYTANLGETLRYLLTERFNDKCFEGHITQKMIGDSYKTLLKYEDNLEENLVEISRQIVKYPKH